MSSVLLAIICGQMTFILAMAVVLLLKARHFISNILSFVLPTGPGEASPLAKVLHALMADFAQELARNITASVMGQNSGRIRGEQAVAGDITMDLLSQSSPLLAGLASLFPSVVKRITKNPALTNFALQKIGELMEKKNPPGNGKEGFSSVLDRLKHI